eukprot:CAMPEP_0181402510 /NCGR_PEP_ID=MMETSP1110-20121109/3212_1 /TAXON_ID=174948 /ORGANISM="Symbiodinium sp., Strain CCMP421" /LENGTH=751 /DNA_ID=CAMNT_0023524731 /DNA_START=33 /DNA_END=2288 /DNA_ORIENTATION=+
MDEEVEDADAFEEDDQEVGVKDEILALAGVELETEPGTVEKTLEPARAESSDFYDEYPLMDNDASEPLAVPQAGIAIPMAATPRFIRAVPEEAELLYLPPDSLFDDIVKSEADRVAYPENVRNRIVYDSVGDPFQADTSAFVPHQMFSQVGQETRSGLKPHLAPYYSPTGPDDRTLLFESRFESGNLRRAVQAYEFEYDLILNPDYNTKSHTQWYFFRVGNTRKGPQYRFNIINMVKPTSVYNEGMRPLMYSCIEASERGVGWVRCGDRIAYYQNGLRRQKGATYYTLTFTVTFANDCDEVYFSHCYPYTYSDLQLDLRAMERDPNMVRRFRRRKLCDTLAGNACDLITITSFGSDPAALKARRAVVITARVHPGESNASWIMKGILDYLTGASVDARILRDNFIFKIVPMLNPDGVIVGNYRCSLAGQDLNRLWDEPSRKMHPTIFFTKSMFRHLFDDRDVVLYVDIHGHSRKKNVFMYGNSKNNGLREKIFPGLLCRSSDCFSFDDCCFKIQKSKESTARVVAYRELGVVNSYTLEASFCGADFGPLGEQHFTTRHLEEMGYMVCDAILDFCDPDQTKVQLVCKELQVLFPDDGNSDDVSDSEDDGAAAMRRKKRADRRKGKKEKPSRKKKKEEEERKEKEPRDSKDSTREKKAATAATSASSVRKVSRRDPLEEAPENSDVEADKSKRKKPKKKPVAKSRAMTSREKDKKEAKEVEDGNSSSSYQIKSLGAQPSFAEALDSKLESLDG